MSLKFWTDNHCEKIKSIECDIWIPAARPDVIDEDNVHRLKAKLVIEGANIPIPLVRKNTFTKKEYSAFPISSPMRVG